MCVCFSEAKTFLVKRNYLIVCGIFNPLAQTVWVQTSPRLFRIKVD